MQLETFVVPATGIGRRDYSQAVEFASQATMRGHQLRGAVIMDSVVLPTVPWPWCYATPIAFFDAEGILRPTPTIPEHFQSIIVTTQRQALVLAGLYRFRTYNDIVIWNPDEWYGDMFGYGRAELLYTSGIKTELGKYYAIALAEWSEEPTFTVSFTFSSLQEEMVYG
jgi:hypothetical protein